MKRVLQVWAVVKHSKTVKTTPLEKLEITLPALFRQMQASNVANSGSFLTENALHIADRLGIENIHASNGWVDRFWRIDFSTFFLITKEAVMYCF